MTRETKIGLLVGLAFIIVIGIMLSDHVSSSGTPQAALSVVGESVRSATAIPPSNSPQAGPVTIPTAQAPQNPVPTRDDLNSQAPGNAVVVVGPAPGQPISIQQTNLPHPTAANTGSASLQAVAEQHGERLVSLNAIDSNIAVAHAPATQPAGQATAAPANAWAYKAESGDTVSRMALKYYSSRSKASLDAIINANPSLKANPHGVVIGKTYWIPKLSTSSAPLASAAPAPSTPPSGAAAALAPSYASYTVKENDTLWRIASSQLGSGTRAGEIKDLNRDVLKGSDNLKIGMVLKLPARMATASAR